MEPLPEEVVLRDIASWSVYMYCVFLRFWKPLWIIDLLSQYFSPKFAWPSGRHPPRWCVLKGDQTEDEQQEERNKDCQTGVEGSYKLPSRLSFGINFSPYTISKTPTGQATFFFYPFIDLYM